jgi:hypothetical protein
MNLAHDAVELLAAMVRIDSANPGLAGNGPGESELAIGTAHRGFVWTEVSVTGVAAQGSRPHLGVDAIFKAGPVLDGPAGDGAHADTEWVSLAATRTCASVLFTLAQGFCA